MSDTVRKDAEAMTMTLVRRMDRLIKAVEQALEAPDPMAYRLAEAAHAVGVGRSTLYVAAKAGDLPVRKLGRTSLVLRTDLETWLSSLPLSDLAELEPIPGEDGG